MTPAPSKVSQRRTVTNRATLFVFPFGYSTSRAHTDFVERTRITRNEGLFEAAVNFGSTAVHTIYGAIALRLHKVESK